MFTLELQTFGLQFFGWNILLQTFFAHEIHCRFCSTATAICNRKASLDQSVKLVKNTSLLDFPLLCWSVILQLFRSKHYSFCSCLCIQTTLGSLEWACLGIDSSINNTFCSLDHSILTRNTGWLLKVLQTSDTSVALNCIRLVNNTECGIASTRTVTSTG